MKKAFLIILMFIGLNSHAQITFQKLYQLDDSLANLQCYDSKATPDGGYVFTGIASEGASNTYHPFVVKINCKGEEEWTRAFGNTQSTANINGKIIVTKDSQYVMINNIGVYSSYNGLVVRLDKFGNVIWQKTLNLSSGNDNITDIYETQNGQLIITGGIKDFPDVGLIKLNANGDLLWSKTFGNPNQYDEGFGVIEANDGGYLLTGRYISMGTFNALLLKTDSMGNMQWLKCYGDSLHNMTGFSLKQEPNDDIIIVGSTTLLKTNYQSFPDNFIMKLNNLGDTLWTKIFYGTPDEYENATSVQIDNQGNYLIGVATASYPTIGIVPNKFALAKFGNNGNFLDLKLFNNGSSHYPRLSKTYDGGFLMGGFSTYFSQPVGFRTLLVKMDQNLNSGCNESNMSTLTVSSTKTFKITQPTPTIGGGGTSVNNTNTYAINILDSTLCQAYPLLQANFTTHSLCKGDTTLFVADTAGISTYHWDFGDVNVQNDTASTYNPSYIYSDTGTYQVQLIVWNGCEYDTQSNAIKIIDCDTIPSSVPPDLHLPHSNCPIIVPNAFSPNGDQLNDVLRPIIPFGNNLKMLTMEIYNRWGKLVFVSNDENYGWDGKSMNADEPVGNYFFMIRYKCNNDILIQKGDIMLVR